MSGLSGKTALVTGASRGIGRASALALAKAGAQVLVHYGTNEKEADAVVAEIRNGGGKAEKVGADLRRLDGAHALAKRVRAIVGDRLDILVANAGISTLGSICTMDATQWSETIDTNLTGVFNAMRAAAPHMRRQRWGRIIGISSMMGRSSNPGIAAYVASKWGVIGLCKSVAFE